MTGQLATYPSHFAVAVINMAKLCGEQSCAARLVEGDVNKAIICCH